RLRLAFFCEKSTLYTAFLLFFRENYATGNVTMAYFSPLADFGAVAVLVSRNRISCYLVAEKIVFLPPCKKINNLLWKRTGM
nr:hypothetical protein [Bacteroidales bacterium]